MNEKTFVIGHKNPDTDSICSAISYARLKQIQGDDTVIAARAGEINSQTEFVLNYFKVDAPHFLADIVPRINQAMTKNVLYCHKDTSLKDLLQLMEERNIRLVPVVDNRGEYHGMVSLFDIAHEFRIEADPETGRLIYTSIKNLHLSLGGKLLCSNNTEDFFDGFFLVGAMQDASFRRVLSELDPTKCLVIAGDREDIQKAAIENKVRGLVVTGDLPVSDNIREMADANGINLLTSPYDTATTVGLVRLSTPVHKVVQNYDGHLMSDEDLHSAHPKILKAYNRGMAVLDSQQKLTGIITMADLLQFSKTKLILVDHNELDQSVEGADKAEIIEVIDHHRLANPQTMQPILFINQPVGSTSTLIAKFYFEQQVPLDKETAGLLISGIISDTINLKSPTTTLVDEHMLTKLNEIAKLDLDDYANQMLIAGVNLAGREPKQIIYNDFKKYKEGRISFGVGQTEVVGFDEFNTMKSAIIEELERIRAKRGYNFIALLATDISTSHSLMIFDGEPILCNMLGYPILEPGVAELKGVLSRKKQLLPHMLNVFKEA
ncbi:putative manganese-dependent inorganic diphosphatase [Thermodesulfobacteriota bacterium]